MWFDFIEKYLVIQLFPGITSLHFIPFLLRNFLCFFVIKKRVKINACPFFKRFRYGKSLPWNFERDMFTLIYNLFRISYVFVFFRSLQIRIDKKKKLLTVSHDFMIISPNPIPFQNRKFWVMQSTLCFHIAKTFGEGETIS